MNQSSPSPSAPECWAASCGQRFQTALVVLASIILAISPPDASAIGPNLPLQFYDAGGVIELMSDPEQFAKLEVDRILYNNGRPVREERLDLKRERRSDGMTVATVPIELSGMPVGYYAMRLVAVGVPSAPNSGAVPLSVEWWLYLAIDKSGARRITNEEYSAAVDPAEHGRDVAGREILLHRGGGTEAKVPLQETEPNQAIPLGRTGGAVEELTTPGYQPKATSPDGRR